MEIHPVLSAKVKKVKLIFTTTDLDKLNGNVELFFKSLEEKINEMFLC